MQTNVYMRKGRELTSVPRVSLSSRVRAGTGAHERQEGMDGGGKEGGGGEGREGGGGRKGGREWGVW
jgi:hypothetical protein